MLTAKYLLDHAENTKSKGPSENYAKLGRAVAEAILKAGAAKLSSDAEKVTVSQEFVITENKPDACVYVSVGGVRVHVGIE